jgi:glycosyltransferase involved in cell wall biosynthesis
LKKGKRPIKIAILDHSPDIGGAETSIVTLGKHIDRSQFSITVILPSEGSFSRELDKIGIYAKVIYLPIGLLRLKRGDVFPSLVFILAYLFYIQFFLMKLFIYLRKNRFDLVMTNTVKAHIYGSIVASLCRIPVIWRFHDILSPTDFSPFLIRIIILFGRWFPKRILAVSKVTKEYLARNGLKDDKIEIIFNGIDSELFEIKDVSKDIRRELKIEGKTKLIGCIGRIIPEKGQKSFLLSIPGVIKKYPEAFSLIIGDVFLKEEAYKEELLEIIKKNGLEERIKFMGFRKDIGDVIRSLDLVIFPSVAQEAFPLSVLEAMALGKPVIASNIGGVSEIIEDGITGMLIEPNHPEQITDRILHLLSNQEIYSSIAQKAKEVVTERFSLQKYVAAMEEAFTRALRFP